MSEEKTNDENKRQLNLKEKWPENMKFVVYDSPYNVMELNYTQALFELKLEIESKLNDLSGYSWSDLNNVQIVQSVRRLLDGQLIDEHESSIILEILPNMDKILFKQNADKKAFQYTVQLGQQILELLAVRIGKDELSKLINSYKEIDGAAHIEIGYELSKQVITNTEYFFEIMKKEPSVFSTWLKELTTSTFTVFEETDEIELELLFSKYKRLKEMMISSVEMYLMINHTSVEANNLLKKLNSIGIGSIN